MAHHSPGQFILPFLSTNWWLPFVIMFQSIVIPGLGLLKYAADLTQDGKSLSLEEGEIVWPEGNGWNLRDLKREG